ncbi:probable phospholipid hydroperoxide glutathione peroxidase isoform X2 [Cimex lectularius]|uniref:Glutathione peroxidase n=1 Tax=Cimex lectularius TaxID=79782 RepID=A0A8I6SU21_CIMLE|nr:probable phospholipid hydroperoxide glutathione peroxidase isoform X2 [Cimex lectularius]XP_024085866.1 probable phospholipid hydroperoxide glutathione peroxidase isoform X2 [Cimex lectularius]
MNQLRNRIFKIGGIFSSASLSAKFCHAQSDTKTVYDFEVRDINGELVSMEKYRGHVLLVVNVASLCGLTATNYKELVELDDNYRDKGLKILAFPCNQFSKQEPGSSEEIMCFAKSKNATFDFFEKIDVNGKNASPLWEYLKSKEGGFITNSIKWNFTKFIVNHKGIPVERHGPTTAPSKLKSSIEKYLHEKEAAGE